MLGQDGMLLDLVIPGWQMLCHKAEEAVDRRSHSTSQRPADRAGPNAMETRWCRTAGVLELVHGKVCKILRMDVPSLVKPPDAKTNVGLVSESL